MTDGEKLAYLAGMAAMYRVATEVEKPLIINNMSIAGASLGMSFYPGMSSDFMYQSILARTDILWMMTPVVFLPPPPAPIVQCQCQNPRAILEFPKGGFWDIIAQEDT